MTASLNEANAADAGHAFHEWGPFAPLPLATHVPISAFTERGAWNRLVNGEAWGRLPGQPQAWLGVIGDPEAKDARIVGVTPDSPAERYGLKPGDVVLRFDGREISDMAALSRAVSECNVDESVVLKVRRGDDSVELRLRLGKKSGVGGSRE
jgi:predicted metalloprotease with PDZ domain